MGSSHRIEAPVISKIYDEKSASVTDLECRNPMNTNSFFKTALFLDRDGIVNRDFGYVYQKEKLELVDGIIELIGFFFSQVRSYYCGLQPIWYR